MPSNTLPTPAWSPCGRVVISPSREGQVSDQARRLIAEELSPATIDALGPDFEIRHCDGANRDELLPAIADVDAILVRSATKVDAEAIAAPRRT